MEPQEIQHAVEELEPQVERLKSLYQQYFMGIEKIPPTILRKNVDRVMWQLRRARFPNVRLRFKFQQIIQRYNTYEQYWARITRQIEQGTFKRDVLRAAKIADADAPRSRRAGAQADAWDESPTPPSLEREISTAPPDSATMPPDAATIPPEAITVPPDSITVPPGPQTAPPPKPQRRLPPRVVNAPVAAAAPAQPASPTATAAPPQAGAGHAAPNGGGEEPTRRIYAEYVEAKRRAGESTAGLTYERLKKSLQDQSNKLRGQHPDRKVEFQVVTKDGKAVIRPILR